MMDQLVAGASLLLAEAGPSNAPADNPEWGKAAPMGLFVLLVFVVACYFLFRSMVRHMRRVPDSFEGAPKPEETPDRMGESKSGLPVLENVDTSSQTPPRLGTPTQLAAEQKQKRAEKVRQAKAKAKARKPPKA